MYNVRGWFTALGLGVLTFVACSQPTVKTSDSSRGLGLPLKPQAVSGFVTRSGNQLRLNNQPFRFSGPNIYWLGLDEHAASGIDYPTEYRVNDALETAREMGATVVRSHLAISTGCPKCVEPTR